MNESGQYPVYRRDGKYVGKVVGTTFKKTVWGSKHFLREPRAICCDTDILLAAKDLGAVTIDVLDKETGVVYTTDIDALLNSELEVNRGHHKQKGLIIYLWERK